jgi:hypothetical protein
MAPTDCLSCLDRPAHGRGVCRRCYHDFWQQVKLGLISWHDLEDAGLCVPVKTRRLPALAMGKEKGHGT